MAAELDDFFKEFPIPFHMGLEERAPFNPLEDMYWRARPDPERVKEDKLSILFNDFRRKLGI